MSRFDAFGKKMYANMHIFAFGYWSGWWKEGLDSVR